MTTAELKEYLAMVVQTEKEVNLQERIYEKMSNEINECEHSIEGFTRRIRSEASRPEEPKLKDNNVAQARVLTIISILTVVITVICWYSTDAYEIYGLVVIDLLLILPALASLLYLFMVMLGEYTNAVKKDKYEYDYAMNNYQNKCKEIEETRKANKRCENEIQQLKIQKQTAEAYRQQVENSFISSRRNLEKMYSYNIVFPKYRNYVMVSSIYEYLCAGRCTTLEGHEGAYNILELEIRLDRIITQLDRILENLAAIRANQYTLYTCLQDTNQMMDALLKEESRMVDSLQGLGSQTATMNARLASLQRSSELTNYLAECNQRELHYMNRMNYLAGHYDNPYGNYAPV